MRVAITSLISRSARFVGWWSCQQHLISDLELESPCEELEERWTSKIWWNEMQIDWSMIKRALGSFSDSNSLDLTLTPFLTKGQKGSSTNFKVYQARLSKIRLVQRLETVKIDESYWSLVVCCQKWTCLGDEDDDGISVTKMQSGPLLLSLSWFAVVLCWPRHCCNYCRSRPLLTTSTRTLLPQLAAVDDAKPSNASESITPNGVH